MPIRSVHQTPFAPHTSIIGSFKMSDRQRIQAVGATCESTQNTNTIVVDSQDQLSRLESSLRDFESALLTAGMSQPCPVAEAADKPPVPDHFVWKVRDVNNRIRNCCNTLEEYVQVLRSELE